MTDATVDIDANVIPEDLRERDQWLMWDASADTPRRPHWRGNFEISWPNPDDWHSFDEAVDAADGRDSWGIGYVFSASNDDHARGLYGVLDLDGCVGEDGRPKDWLPALQPFFDVGAYMEYSPSGEGIHIPLAGLEQPEWWSDSHFTDDEHEGVEVLTNKFCTFTSDQVRNSGEDVADTDEYVDEWLTQAYKAVNGEDPRGTETEANSSSQGGGSHGENHSSPGHSGGDLGVFDVISSTEYPVGENAAHPFHPSGTGKNFKVMDDGDSWRCWRHDTGGYAIALVGQEAGLMDCSDNFSQLSDAEQRDVYDAARERGYIPDESASDDTGGTATDGGTASASADAGGPTGGESEDDPLAPDYPLTRRNGGYALHHPARDEDSDGWYEQLTNFEVEARTFLRSADGDDVQADLTVHPGNVGKTYDVTVPMTAFNDLRAFKGDVVTGRTTRFDGDTGDLNELREFVGSQPAPERTGVERIGLFGAEFGELVTPAGTLGARDWLDEPDHAYVQQGIGIEAKWSLDRDGGAEFDRDVVAEALETLPQTREADRLLPVLGWFYASGFRPLIHEWTGEFNILNVTGGTGAGKSSTLGVLWQLFGMDDDPLSVAEETKFAVTRSMAATNAVPVWFDEYKPATTDSWRIDALHGLLRTVTRGGTVQRGNADKTTDEYTLSAPVAVSGEQRIQGSAEQRRCIMTTFSPSSANEGTDTARAYKELTGEGYLEDGEFVGTDAVDPQAHAIAYYQFVAGFDEADARERWDAAAVDVVDMLDELDEADGLGSAARQGLQTVVFGLRLYRAFAESVGADIGDLISEEAIESAVRYSGAEFIDGGHKSHVDTIVELVAAAARSEYIEEDEHYSVVKSGSPAAEIRVNMTAAFDQITRYVRDHDVSADILDTYGDYRDRFKEACEENGGYVVSYRQNTRGIGRAIGIHARRATDALDGFEARALNCEIIKDREDRDDRDDRDDSDGPDGGGRDPVDEIPQADRLPLVRDLVNTIGDRDDGAEHARVGDVVNAAMDAGMDEPAANSALDKLSKQGDIYQPLTGQYRVK